MSKNYIKAGGMQYDRYSFTGRDWLEYGLRTGLKGMVICYLFYDSLKAGLLLIPFGVMDYRKLRKKKLEQQKRTITLQFREFSEAIANGLGAGYSLEGAVKETKKDLELVFPSNAFIFQEIEAMLVGLQMNVPIEQLFQNFGSRSGIEDIRNFANVVTVAKRSGGNLVHIIRKTINSIGDKLTVEEEIETMIAAKKYEEKIMMLMPYGIIGYLKISNGSFFDVLYHNLLGGAIMTLFLLVIYLADVWAQKIMEIEV